MTHSARRLARRAAALAALLLSSLPALAQNNAAAPGPTLQAVRDRGELRCGANQNVPGFGAFDSRGEYRGIDGDICRAIAAAVLGNGNRIHFTPLSSQARIPALQSGEVDVVARTFTWTQSRDAGSGLQFTAITYYDGQGIMVRRSLGVTEGRQLDGASICVTTGTTTELNLVDWARRNRLNIQPIVFEQNEETRLAYEAGRCDALTGDASQLVGRRLAMSNPGEHIILPDVLSKEPHTPAVRKGDAQWFDIVRWTVFALQIAEELGVTQANAEEMLTSSNPEIRRLLGVSGDHGAIMGLDARWAYNAIRAVGNYGEIFDRNLGPNTPLGLQRGRNALWSDGGLIYPPPIR